MASSSGYGLLHRFTLLVVSGALFSAANLVNDGRERGSRMKNVIFLLLAVIFFGIAFYVYWVVARENGLATEAMPGATRGVAPRAIAPPSELMAFIQQWQPYLSVLSSIGGIASFLFQVRVWMRGSS